MKMGKKILVVLLSLCLAFSTAALFTACGDTKYQVGVFVYKYDDNYITTVRTALEAKFKTYENMEVTFYNGEGTQSTQTAQIDAAITSGVDLLIINPVDFVASGDNLAKKCKDAGKPAIFFNREISDAAVKTAENICFVGTDANKPGYMLGEMISEMVNTQEKYDKYDLNNDGQINYVMIRAEVGNAEADGRTKFSVDEANRLIKANPAITTANKGLNRIGSDENAEWDTTKAQDKMAAFLSSNPMTGDNPVEMVICNNDGMAMGVLAALNIAGYNTAGSKTAAGGKYIPVFGVDAISDATAAIKAGRMEGTVKQDGQAMAEAIVAIANNVQTGKEFLAGTEYKFDAGVKKLRIPYAKYVG